MSVPRLLTTYNDVSIGQLSALGNKPELEFGPGPLRNEIEVRSGASLMGWATSTDGQTWSYRGKIRPFGGNATEERWAFIYVDPSIGLDEADPNLLYAVQLGVSQATFDNFDTAYLGDPDDRVALLAALPPDGFCVARSTNGGDTMGRGYANGQITQPGVASCFRPPNTPPFDPFDGSDRHLDKTAAAVDWLGRLWVAIEDRGEQSPFNRIRVFRNRNAGDEWDVFDEIPVCSQSATAECLPDDLVGNIEPTLRAGPRCTREFSSECFFTPAGFGAIWLGSLEVDLANPAVTPKLRIAQFGTDTIDGAQCASGPGCPSGVCDSASNLCVCSSDSQCAPELECSAGRCRTRDCTTSADCPGASTCNATYGFCQQIPGWAGAKLTEDYASQCPGLAQMANGNPDIQIAAGVEAITMRGAFRYSFDSGFDLDGFNVLRVAYLYRVANPIGPDQSHIQVLRLGQDPLDPVEVVCTESAFQNTILLTNPGTSGILPQEFQPVVDWHDRSTPIHAGSEFEWQLGFLGNNRSIDRSKRYLHGVGMTLWRRSVAGVTVDTIEAPVPLHGITQSSTHYACPDTRGYWGDYFGLTQFHNADFELGQIDGIWLNAASFTASALRPAGAPDPCGQATQVYGAPMDVAAFTWPSATYVVSPFP